MATGQTPYDEDPLRRNKTSIGAGVSGSRLPTDAREVGPGVTASSDVTAQRTAVVGTPPPSQYTRLKPGDKSRLLPADPNFTRNLTPEAKAWEIADVAENEAGLRNFQTRNQASNLAGEYRGGIAGKTKISAPRNSGLGYMGNFRSGNPDATQAYRPLTEDRLSMMQDQAAQRAEKGYATVRNAPQGGIGSRLPMSAEAEAYQKSARQPFPEGPMQPAGPRGKIVRDVDGMFRVQDPSKADVIAHNVKQAVGGAVDSTKESVGQVIKNNAARIDSLPKDSKLVALGKGAGKGFAVIGAAKDAYDVANNQAMLNADATWEDRGAQAGQDAAGLVGSAGGAYLGGQAGVALGAATGPAAPVAVPVLGLAGAAIGGYYGDEGVKTLIRKGREALGLDAASPVEQQIAAGTANDGLATTALKPVNDWVGQSGLIKRDPANQPQGTDGSVAPTAGPDPTSQTVQSGSASGGSSNGIGSGTMPPSGRPPVRPPKGDNMAFDATGKKKTSFTNADVTGKPDRSNAGIGEFGAAQHAARLAKLDTAFAKYQAAGDLEGMRRVADPNNPYHQQAIGAKMGGKGTAVIIGQDNPYKRIMDDSSVSDFAKAKLQMRLDTQDLARQNVQGDNAARMAGLSIASQRANADIQNAGLDAEAKSMALQDAQMIAGLRQQAMTEQDPVRKQAMLDQVEILTGAPGKHQAVSIDTGEVDANGFPVKTAVSYNQRTGQYERMTLAGAQGAQPVIKYDQTGRKFYQYPDGRTEPVQ